MFKRISTFLYGVVSYGVGVAALVALILITLGVLGFTGGPVSIESFAGALVFNVALLLAFGIQHSVMARKWFKERWTKIIPEAAERSTFVLATALVLGPALYLWQPMPEVIWDVSNPIARVALTAACVAGWGYLFVSTFAIDHFELFGLRQVWDAMRGNKTERTSFQEKWMYRFDRHPIMTGAILGIWMTPTMTADHLLLAVMSTLYVMVGVHFEERALRREWGERYAEYASRVGTIVPRLPLGKRAPTTSEERRTGSRPYAAS
ncbi:MAG: isoprenylcysteine carboxylmethyltransferase family protein [Deltaproteobacteria bacterium]|jgi:protein-S-isoprenylcysteine O-methyltransferase Ste14